MTPYTCELRRILRTAARRALALEQAHYPRRPCDIARSVRLFTLAESHNAYSRKG